MLSWRTISRTVLGAAVVAATPGFVWAQQTLEGHWEGAIELPSMELEVDIDFTQADEEWTGDISIPQQNAVDLPLVNIVLGDDGATFSIEGIPGNPTFDGTFADEGKTLSGDFTQAGQTFPFILTTGKSAADTAREALADMRAVIEPSLEQFDVAGLSIAVVVEGEVVFLEGFGHRNVEDELPVTKDTLFAIGSSTKAFTTFAMATLAEDELVDWDEPVVKYLPDFRLWDEHRTMNTLVRDLVTHRTGYPRHDLVWYNNQDAERADLVHRIQYLEPNKQLREAWQYNNLMYLTAGYLMEQITGKTWEEVIQERILDPLNMDDTVMSIEAMQQADDYALPYLEKDGEIKPVPFRPIDVMGPAGSINSSAEDMVNWMIVNLEKGEFEGEQVLSRVLLQDLHTPQMVLSGGLPSDSDSSPVSYAMGWMTSSYKGHYEVSHGGNIDGFSALVSLYPYDRVGVVALANANGTPLPSLATRHIIDRVFDLGDRNWIEEAAEQMEMGREILNKADEDKELAKVENTTPSHSLGKYAADYEHPGYGIISVEKDGERLTAVYNDMRMPLEHWHFETFNVKVDEDDEEIVPEDLKITFHTNSAGQVDRLSVPFEPLLYGNHFNRVPVRQLSDPEYLDRLVGTYELGPQTLRIHRSGVTLKLEVTGQPLYVLNPAQDGEYTLDGVTGFRVRFKLPEEGPATELISIQPNGVFTATRMSEDSEEDSTGEETTEE